MALEITQFCMQNETNQGHRIKSLVLNSVLKCITFVLNNRLVFEDPASSAPPPPGSPQAHSALEQSLMRVAIVIDCHGIDLKLNPKRTSCYRLIILSRNFS